MSEQTRILTPEEADRCANSHTLFLSHEALRASLAAVEADNACVRIENAKAFETIKEIVAQRDEAREKLASAQADGWCDVCTGTGKPASGEPCMCGGTGLAASQVTYLRETLAAVELRVETAERMREQAVLEASHFGKRMEEAEAALAQMREEKANGLYGADRVAKLIQTYAGIEQRAEQAESRCAALEARETRVRDVLTQLETYRRQPIRTFNPSDEVEVLRQERVENGFMDAWLPRLRAALAADAPATPPATGDA